MLGFFKAFERRIDHPMATVADARAMLEALPDEPVEALEQLANWLASLRDTDGFPCDDRLAVVKEVDQVSIGHARAVFAGFFARIRQRDRALRKSFDLLCEFWNNLSGAYARCAADEEYGEKNAARVLGEMPLALARTFRAAGLAARMRHLRYVELEPSLWPGLARQLAYAELRRIEDTAVVPYPKEVHSTPRAELLKILGLYLAAPHELPTEQVELAYRILDRFAASFAWSREPKKECNFVIDLGVQARPRHVSDTDSASPSRRYFGGGPALAKLEELEKLCEANMLSEEARFGEAFSPAQIVTVIRHLRTYLGRTPPQRHFARSPVSADLSVVHGFAAICQRVAAIAVGASVKLRDDLDVEVRKRASVQLIAEEIETIPEVWRERDRSEWGMGADLPQRKGQWAEPGVLCGVRDADDAPWWVGIIRRLESDDAGHMHCGFWILSKKPMSVWLRVIGTEAHKADNWETSTGSFSYTYMRAILLPDALKSHDHPIILLERSGFVPGELCELMIGEHSRTIQLIEFLEGGADYVRAAFAWYQGKRQ